MGRDLYGALKEEYETNKNQKNVHYIDKTRYSAFAGTDLDIRLRERTHYRCIFSRSLYRYLHFAYGNRRL